jgi:hypothetical protein
MAPHIHAYRAGLAAMVGLGAKSTYDSHRKIAQTGAAHGGAEDTNGVPGTLGRRLTRRNTNGGLMSSTASFNSFQEELKKIAGRKNETW